MNNIAGYLDSTLLKPEAPLGAYSQFCRDAIEFKVASVCVNSFHVPLVASLLNAHPLSKVKTCSTIAFPFGTEDLQTKVNEIDRAISKGAHELDVVVNLSLVKTAEWKRLNDELIAIREASEHHILKIILEVGMLTDEEIKTTSKICLDNRVNFLKTSTGFNCKLEPQKTADYVAMLKRLTDGTRAEVKASGGIRSLSDANLMIAAGATRIGTSNAVGILKELNEK